MKISVKTKIRYNGQEYSDPTELPPEIRAAYEKAMRGEAAATSRKFTFNSREFSSRDMPADMRRLSEDVMSVIESNGEVTFPQSRDPEPLMTKRQLSAVALVVAMLLALATVALVTR